MKLTELLEDVVNLADVRKRKQVDALSKEFDQYEQLETSAGEALDEMYSKISTLLGDLRVPGFKGIDDIAGYLFGDVGMPRNKWPKVWNDWLQHLPKEDSNRVRMIAHHAPRLIAKLQQALDQINAFDKEWSAAFDKLPNAKARARVFDKTHMLREEVWHNIQQLTTLSAVMSQLT